MVLTTVANDDTGTVVRWLLRHDFRSHETHRAKEARRQQRLGGGGHDRGPGHTLRDRLRGVADEPVAQKFNRSISS